MWCAQERWGLRQRRPGLAAGRITPAPSSTLLLPGPVTMGKWRFTPLCLSLFICEMG